MSKLKIYSIWNEIASSSNNQTAENTNFQQKQLQLDTIHIIWWIDCLGVYSICIVEACYIENQ